ncbi:MAG TPA: M43 family zinc metalloprotease [Flavisolibacter sp.]|nr:M43 family zinc metalloprotease [Flavisolibacter sp.]
MRAIFLSVLISGSLSLSAQRSCGTSEYSKEQRMVNPAIAMAQATIENFIQQGAIQSSAQSVAGSNSSSNVIRIPVVIHVLYNGEAQNVSEAQIRSGIDALNRDFRKRNSDTANTPWRFKGLAADVEIEFALATSDPKCSATTGINRKWTPTAEWKMDDKIKASVHGGADAWDCKSYLNIWIGGMRKILGYASQPGGAADKDGIVINTSSFGTIATGAPFNMGRTAVHEVGHWLGLKHVWGDTYCGDDQVYDTPVQGNFTTGCPSTFRSSCSNGEAGDMYMNYMDFTDDACMNLFTEGQKQRMRVLFNNGGPRASLLHSKGLSEPWTDDSVPEETPPAVINEFKVYPNPAASFIVLDFSHDATWIGKEIALLNINGSVVKKEKVSAKTQRLYTAFLKPGLYFIQAQNGDQKILQKFIKL